MLENTMIYNAKQEGIKEEKIEIAKTMLKKGISIEDISEITGLTIDEIKKIMI